METPRDLLFIYGFLKKGSDYAGYGDEMIAKRRKLLKRADKDKKKKLRSEVDEEIIETADGHLGGSGYPSSQSYIKLVHEAPNQNMEEGYFWIVEHLRQDRGFHEIIKVQDVYAASEASAFWGNQQQRISAQQNQASGFLANIGKFVKELFQMVRELRIIDERLEAYDNWEKSESADVTLKSIFTDQVEGGTKNPQSVFGLAGSVGFTLLPDLFFNTHIYDVDELDERIEQMEYNESVKNVLRRKLYQFIQWKEHTHKELRNRRKFNLQYLKQHWAIIQMYIQWVKPHLRNIRRLQMNQSTEREPELVSSFDQSLAEVEVLAKRPDKKGAYPVVIVNCRWRTRPDMSIRKEYQQGPSHMGRLEVEFRAYAWTEEQIVAYQQMREAEEFALLGMIDTQLTDIMEALGDDFRRYLDQQEDKDEEEEEGEPTFKKAQQDVYDSLDPFISIFGGFKELFGAFVPARTKKKKSSSGADFGGAAGEAKFHMFLTFHIYKKAHRLLSW